MKRIIALGVVVLIVVIVWTGAWFWAAGQATAYVKSFETADGVTTPRVTCATLGSGRILAAFREHLGTDVGGVSPDGAVRLEQTNCGGASVGVPRVEVDGEVLPHVSADDAVKIAAALRTHVVQGRPA